MTPFEAPQALSPANETNETSAAAVGHYPHNPIGHAGQSHTREHLQTIAVDLIDAAPQMRTEFAGIDELAQRIAAEGLQQPLTVTLTESGRYLLVTGERRLRAVKSLRWESVSAFVHEALSTESFLTMQWSENESRQNLSPCERTQAILKIITEIGIDKARSVLGNKSRAWVKKYADVHYFPDQTRCLLEAGMCGEIDTLTLLAKMEREKDEHLASNAPHDQWTFRAFTEAFETAKRGALSVHAAREATTTLQRALQWAIQSKQRTLEAEARSAEANKHTEAQQAQRKADEARAKTDPAAAARLQKQKQDRKQQREAKAQKNREKGYRYRLNQAAQAGTQANTAARKLIEACGERETEQRLLFMTYQAVRNSVVPLLASLDDKHRKAFMRGIDGEVRALREGKAGEGGDGIRDNGFTRSTETTPPAGWVLP